MTIHENKCDLYLERATVLNRDCLCVTLNQEVLHRNLYGTSRLQKSKNTMPKVSLHMFAKTPYFISSRQTERMAELIHAIESVISLPAYKKQAFAWAPQIAHFDPGTLGVFFGYDFHLLGTVPKLIEINTNAGGALLNTRLAGAQQSFSPEISDLSLVNDSIPLVELNFVNMFRNEWRRQRYDRPLRSIAIVDVDPQQQFLNLEFQLFKRLFQENGIITVVADPAELEFRNNALWHHNLKIDLVYNRLTDFSLSDPSSAAIREAYLNSDVVLTPHPQAHAMYADKRNLTLLSDDGLLNSWGVPDSIRATLRSGIPKTVLVTSENCQKLWSERRRLFFKPSAGYGSKAAYRGDKLTRRVWQEILAGDYIAQEFVPPSQRRVQVDGKSVVLKVDLRNFVYNGHVQLLAARMYQGQTTNLRTAGGGFTAVFKIDKPGASITNYTDVTSQSPNFDSSIHLFGENYPLTSH